MVAQFVEHLSRLTKAWVSSHKPGMAVRVVILVPGRLEREFKVILSYTMSLRPASYMKYSQTATEANEQ